VARVAEGKTKMDIDGDGEFDVFDYILLDELERDDEPGEENTGCLVILVLAVLMLDFI